MTNWINLCLRGPGTFVVVLVMIGHLIPRQVATMFMACTWDVFKPNQNQERL